jgi:hypothetical protein
MNVFLAHYRTKLLQKSQGTLSRRRSFCCPTIVLFRPGALNPWLLLLLVDNVDSPFSNVSHAMHRLVKSLLWQKCCGSRKRSKISTCERFKLSVTHTPELHVQHTKPLKIKDRVCCVRVCNFSILAWSVMKAASIYPILWESRVFLDLFWVVYVLIQPQQNANLYTWASRWRFCLFVVQDAFSQIYVNIVSHISDSRNAN